LLLDVGLAYGVIVGLVLWATITVRHWYPEVVSLAFGDWRQAVWPHRFVVALIAASVQGVSQR
jgi:hypothetical protein